MTDEEFEEHVRAALDALPPKLAEALENVAVVVEEEKRGDPRLFGEFLGLGPGRDRTGALPDQVVIYRRPLEAAFPDPDELEREIRITVLHELAHYFGIEEDRLDELGYA